jgi:hypothetical protein
MKLKILAISIICLLVWWGAWGHAFTSDGSEFWFRENSQGCAPAYPIIAVIIIVLFWGVAICMQGGIKFYHSTWRENVIAYLISLAFAMFLTPFGWVLIGRAWDYLFN